jgi:hypothetical protein
MAELKNMTVQALRDLARKALGKGHSRLKTKTELIQALQAAERKVTGVAEKAAGKAKEAAGRAARATERVMEGVRGKGSKEAAPKARSGAKETPPAKAVKVEERAEKRAEPKPERKAPDRQAEERRADERKSDERKSDERRRAASRRSASQGPEAEPEPDPEGHMVARVMGEDAARRAPHPMTESAMESRRAERPTRPQPAPAYDEGLGDLPWTYSDDSLVALPRDPKTLFLYWDHAQETLRHAWEGLDGGRPQLWVYAQGPNGRWERVRVVDFALESRSYYIHDLDPGRIYRAEIHVVDRQGRDKLLPQASNPMMLPAVGPSPVIDDRFMRILWSEPLQRLLRDATPGGAFPEELRAQLMRLSDWSRFQPSAGGSSAGAFGAAGGAGAGAAGAGAGAGLRPTSPWVRPSSFGVPSSPWGWSGEEDP